jgi:hypothetical protein
VRSGDISLLVFRVAKLLASNVMLAEIEKFYALSLKLIAECKTLKELEAIRLWIFARPK